MIRSIDFSSALKSSPIALGLFLLNAAPVAAQSSPYPSSNVISGVSFDVSGATSVAPGSDLWPLAWAADGNLYTAWGDGGGFGGTNQQGRVSLGVGRVSGSGSNYSGTNIFGGHNGQVSANFVGKPTGLLAVNGVLYMAVVEQGAWLRLKITRSNDNGRTWDFNSRGWDFSEPDGAFSDLTFLTFGQDYSGARDGYVYAYSQEQRTQSSSTEIALARVPVNQIQSRSAYQFYAGKDASGNPSWTSNINQRQPVFRDPAGVGWGVRVVYNPGLDRYLLTTWHDQNGGWGIFDAPEPWGPWTTVAYFNNWLDSQFKFGFNFNQKWMSADGKTAWMVFSGTNQWDAFVAMKATFTVAGGADTSPPTTPSGLSTTVQGQSRIDLSWNAASDPESGVASYNVYRGGSKVGSSTSTSYSDTGLSAGTTYSYRVAAVNGAGIEGSKSSARSATTQSPPPPPPAGDTTKPTTPSGLQANAVGQSRIDLSWNAASDPESGVASYNVYRGGSKVGSSTSTSYSDTGLSAGTTYSYRVAAVNGAGIEGSKSSARSATTQSPPPPSPPPPSPPPPGSGGVTVSNIQPRTGSSYAVGQTPLGANVVQYTDRAFAFDSVPGGLQGLTYIQTANDDKNSMPGASDFLTFNVDRDVVVYVAHDDRAQRPGWLTAAFVDTGMNMQSGGGTYSVFQREFSAGSVQLGSNVVSPSSVSMYSVVLEAAAQPQPDTTAPAPPAGLRIVGN